MRLHTILLLLTPALNAAVPTAPTGFEASDATTPFEIGLSWEHVRGAEIYRIFRGTTSDFSSATSIGITESITFKDSTGPGETYFYWIRAEGSSGTSSLAGPEQGSTSTAFSPFRPPIQLTGLIPTPTIAVPTGSPTTGARVYLGKTMFWDEQLSSTRTTACGTCHIFRAGGADARAGKGVTKSTHPGLDGVIGTADDAAGSMGVPSTRADGSYQWSPLFGLNPQVTPRRASSVLDAAFAVQGVLWDGKPGFAFNDPVTNRPIFTVNASLEAQALLPFLNTTEMAHEGRTIADVVTRIAESRPLALSPSVPPALARWIDGRTYTQLFEEAFGTPEITAARIAMSISSYERTLIADRTGIDGMSSISALATGIGAFGAGRCTICHRTPLTSDGQFHVTGLRPVAEDQGRGKVTNQPSDMASFRTPSLRNAGLRTGFQHTGMLSLEEVVEFYNRGGDFKESVGFVNGALVPLNLSAQQKADLVTFLRNATIDKRVERESAPLFDRPLLYSESARVPVVLGPAEPSRPQVVALEPPYAGNPRFTVAVSNIAPRSQAVLVIDRADPGESPSVTAVPPFFRGEIAASDDGAGHGFASISLPIPADRAGITLFGRWYITTNGATTSSPAFRFTIFAAGPGVEDFTSLSAAGLSKGVVASESIVSGFGSGLASSTVVAPSGALPTTLGGLRVSITDRTGVSSDAPLYFVSAGQINYIVPAAVAEGEASVRVLRVETVIARGVLQVVSLAPSLFAANSDGRDTAAALVQRISDAGAITVSSPTAFDAAQQRFVPVPIDLGAESDQTFLLLFGTGIRGRGEGLVTATIGGTPVGVLYAGPQGEFAGMDQVNLSLPRSLIGRGALDLILTVDGKRANQLRIAVR